MRVGFAGGVEPSGSIRPEAGAITLPAPHHPNRLFRRLQRAAAACSMRPTARRPRRWRRRARQGIGEDLLIESRHVHRQLSPGPLMLCTARARALCPHSVSPVMSTARGEAETASRYLKTPRSLGHGDDIREASGWAGHVQHAVAEAQVLRRTAAIPGRVSLRPRAVLSRSLHEKSSAPSSYRRQRFQVVETGQHHHGQIGTRLELPQSSTPENGAW